MALKYGNFLTSPAIPVSTLFLFMAIIVYGLFGSPTPDNPGLVESLVGGLLVLSIGVSGLRNTSDFSLGRNGFLKALQVLFLCGLVVPMMTGVYYGNDHVLMLRDVLAFMFLGVPLFLSERFNGRKPASDMLCLLLVLSGILFSVRTLLPAFNVWVPQGELLYLSNSPLTLFAAIFLAGRLWTNLSNLNRTNILACLLMATGLAVLIAAMLLDVQRATIGAILATILILAVFDLIHTPRRVVGSFLVLIIVGFLLYPVVNEILGAMASKTARVGFNMRVQEAQAVFDALGDSPLALFAGLGWGSVVASPAVGGLDVNYTHSLLTTMELKGGLIVLMLTVIVIIAALYQITFIFQRDRGQALALFWPLVIPVFLYASHKSLDFGLLLLMIGVWSNEGATLHHSEGSCKTRGHLEE